MRRLLTVLLLLVAVEARAQSHPVFFATAQDNARYAAYKTNYDLNPDNPPGWGGKFYKMIKLAVDSNNIYADDGLWGALLYRMSGNAAYAAQSYGKVTTTLLNKTDTCSNNLQGNFSREYGWRYALIYDWIYNALTSEQRDAFRAKHRTMMSCHDTFGWVGGSDSDQTAGDYFHSAMMMQSAGGYDAALAAIWAGGDMGGFAATGTDKFNRRNSVSYYSSIVGLGGMWGESTEYNLNTIKIACMGAAALRSAQSPTDNFADVGTFCESAAGVLMSEVTPGINHATSKAFVWGDTQQQDSLIPNYRSEACLVLSGVNQGKTIGPYIQDWCLDYFDSGIPLTLSTSSPYPRGFIIFDPDATRGDHTTYQKTTFAPGMGWLNTRTGWTSADTALGIHLSGLQGGLHHAPYYFGEFQIWKNGYWAMTHPLSYGGYSADHRGVNGMGLRGLPYLGRYTDFFEYKAGDTWADANGVIGYPDKIVQRTDTGNGFVYMAGTTGGSHEGYGGYAPPPTWMNEHSRSFVWLSGLQVLAVYDRTNVETEAEGACTTGWNTTLLAWSNTRPRKELFFHMPVSPTVEAGYVEWAYSGTKKIRVNNLLPVANVRTPIDETIAWGASYASNGVRKGWHIQMVPTADQRWDTFLNVYDPYEDGTPATTTLVQDVAASAEGVLIARSGVNYLLAFNALQGPDLPNVLGVTCGQGPGGVGYTGLVDEILDVVRHRDAGYTLSFTGPGGGTKALLFDLDPNTTWDYSINGGAAADLTVDANGVGVVDIAQTGAVTLAVISAGVLPVSVQTGSLPNGRVGTAYSQALTAIGGIGAPYTWTKTVGDFPSALSLADDTISGTPDTAGTETFTVQACDGDTNCGTRQLSITIDDIPSITTAGLPDGAVGVAYSEAVATTGGTAPYVYTLDSGTLCDGLSLSAGGVISGTPTTVEECQFVVLVTDDNAITDSQALGITVLSSLLPITVTAAPGSTTAVITHSTPSLDYNDSCTVNILDGETVEATATSATGGATRQAHFTGLFASQTYGVDVICGTATSTRIFFQTLAPDLPPSTGDWTYTVKPHARLAARGVTKVQVSYTLLNQTPAASPEVITESCASGCTVALPLASGNSYTIGHVWLTAADATVATSRDGTVAVP